MLADPKSLIDPNTERELIATCLAHPQLAASAFEMTSAEHFGEPLYGKLFRAMNELLSAGKPLNEFALDSLLSGQQFYDSHGGLQFLVDLSSCAAIHSPETALAGLAEAVHKNYLRRFVRNAALSTAERAEDKLILVDDVISELREKVTELEDESQASQRTIVRISEVAGELTPILQRLSEKRGEMLGFTTGYRHLDRKSSGFPPGALTILAARPSMGKTAFALCIALLVALKGIPVAIFSLETPRDMLTLRLACRYGRIDLSALTSGNAEDGVWKELTPAIAAVSQLPIYIDDRPRVKASDLRWRIRSAARRFGVRLAIVDYLQLATGKGDTRNDEVASVSGELQAAARELGQINSGALLALSQLSRLGDRERPRLSHLRDSGAIEQDADAVWFLCEPEGTRPGQFEPSTKELDIAKSRNGPTDTVRFDYFGQCMAFEERV
jgi:replicative DNA helicase